MYMSTFGEMLPVFTIKNVPIQRERERRRYITGIIVKAIYNALDKMIEQDGYVSYRGLKFSFKDVGESLGKINKNKLYERFNFDLTKTNFHKFDIFCDAANVRGTVHLHVYSEHLYEKLNKYVLDGRIYINKNKIDFEECLQEAYLDEKIQVKTFKTIKSVLNIGIQTFIDTLVNGCYINVVDSTDNHNIRFAVGRIHVNHYRKLARLANRIKMLYSLRKELFEYEGYYYMKVPKSAYQRYQETGILELEGKCYRYWEYCRVKHSRSNIFVKIPMLFYNKFSYNIRCALSMPQFIYPIPFTKDNFESKKTFKCRIIDERKKSRRIKYYVKNLNYL